MTLQNFGKNNRSQNPSPDKQIYKYENEEIYHRAKSAFLTESVVNEED